MILFQLLVAHALLDFPLQGDFLAKHKNRHYEGRLSPTYWIWCLSAHALIHGGGVYLVTGSLGLGISETILHWLIDFARCEQRLSVDEDQVAHVACKVLWFTLPQLH